MTIKFQYNKIALQNLNKQLNIRLRALPTLKNKEATLRLEVKRASDKISALKNELRQKMEKEEEWFGLWNEFVPGIISMENVNTVTWKIAGMKVPVLDSVVFKTRAYSQFDKPNWFHEGIGFFKEVVTLRIDIEINSRKKDLLNYSRKKTTQKVNLYEKVQIPEYEEAIQKIKRFLYDAENLSKSAQKIVKRRQELSREEEI